MNEIKPQTPHFAVYVLLRRGGQVAFIKRGNTGWMDGYYGLPSGKVDVDENALHAAVREAKEEVGVTIEKSKLKYLLTLHRKADEENSKKPEWVDVYFETDEWEGEPYNAEPDKHSSLDWFSLNQIPNNTVPAVKFALEQIAASKMYGEFGPW